MQYGGVILSFLKTGTGQVVPNCYGAGPPKMLTVTLHGPTNKKNVSGACAMRGMSSLIFLKA